jgi:glucan phosphorylase
VKTTLTTDRILAVSESFDNTTNGTENETWCDSDTELIYAELHTKMKPERHDITSGRDGVILRQSSRP